jgi:hypothetical protein
MKQGNGVSSGRSGARGETAAKAAYDDMEVTA